jgi:hypothetical protein
LRAVSRISRNASCPCGSGLKYKRCCLDRKRELERVVTRQAEALDEILALPTFFPLGRADSPEFEAWAAERATEDPTLELVDEGLALLHDDERRRIVDAYADTCTEAWRGMVAETGDERVAEVALLAGAVTAALQEWRELDCLGLELLEDGEGGGRDAADDLSLVVDCCDLWSVVEAARAEEAIAAIPDEVDDAAYELLWTAAFEREAARLRTARHERRLAILVARVRGQLPVSNFPRASRLLIQACDAFQQDASIRSRLAAMLLADTLGPLRLLDAYAAAA